MRHGTSSMSHEASERSDSMSWERPRVGAVRPVAPSTMSRQASGTSIMSHEATSCKASSTSTTRTGQYHLCTTRTGDCLIDQCCIGETQIGQCHVNMPRRSGPAAALAGGGASESSSSPTARRYRSISGLSCHTRRLSDRRHTHSPSESPPV